MKFQATVVVLLVAVVGLLTTLVLILKPHSHHKPYCVTVGSEIKVSMDNCQFDTTNYKVK